MSIRPGRILLTLVAIMTSTGCYVADWNESHIYNPHWTGHAKFHNGQTMSMGLLLGIAALYYLYAPLMVVSKQAAKANLGFVVLLNSLYWVTQGSAYFYPGTVGADPPSDMNPMAQAYLDVVLLSVTAVGWWLESARLEAM
ncbi:hypothetical protein K490DRAFT_31356 [Saccharata proteae CBS 121410]|uniref:Acetyltransferase n=1 Tax=Saccharata proteae CBS 121410 TaxID=1314787 RepID=A0A9P4I1N8_9PEZI|nr:hypothetical protein K490DRAFT_31356 [Saccharata proteae CBS 121410]